MNAPRYRSLRSSKRSAPSHSTEQYSSYSHYPCNTPKQVHHSLNYLAPTQWSYPSYPADCYTGVPSWNFNFASEVQFSPCHFYPSSSGMYIILSPRRRSCLTEPTVSPSPSVYSFSSSSDHQFTSYRPSPSPGPTHVVCATPIISPRPRIGTRPVVLSCELPALDEDLSGLRRMPKRKRSRDVDDDELSLEPACKLRRSARLKGRA